MFRYSIALIFAEIALAAGKLVADIRRSGYTTAWKADSSPVTQADTAAEGQIVRRLTSLMPGLPIVAEELVAAGRVPDIGNAFILADPLDGTREFVAGRKECTINLALVEDGRPVAGAIYAPLTGQLWLSGRESLALAIAPEDSLAKAMAGARRITVRRPPPSGLVALVSRSHPDPATQNYLSRLPIVERRALGSSLKFCLIAQGEADIYPRLSETCEWDTAAGHAILAAAGGDVSAPDGRPLRYGNRAGGFRHHGFVACGGFRITAGGKLANA